MKPLLSLSALLLTALGAHAQAQAVWLDEHHDFGAFDESLGVVTCVFEAVNTGNEPLVILNARANCGCTTPTYSPEPVAPGDTARVTVGYNADGRPGRFSKNVAVTTNARQSKTTLTISGTVIGTANTLRSRYPVDAGAMKLRSAALAYGEVSRRATGGQYVEGYNASSDTLRPRVTYTPPYISAIVSPAAVPPGENFVISTTFDPTRCPLYDVVTDSLTVEADGHTVTLSTVGIVTEDFSTMTGAQMDRAPVISVTPAQLDFGRIDTSVSSPLSATLEIANNGHEPLKLRRVYSADSAVSVAMKSSTVKPGKRIKLKISIDRASLAGKPMLNSRLIIIANDPANPRTTVRLTGEIPSTPHP